MNHETVTSFSCNRKELVLYRKINKKYFQQKIPFNEENAKMQSLVVNTPLAPNTVQNVKNILRMSINPLANAIEIEEISQLLLNFKDVFGKDGNSELGLYPFEMKINTAAGKA